ncbi:MAG: tRNA epoxyqueuosine(34) reductase QueG [Actinomycetota bacterium]|jgi:epoxyqueuosine reductase
MPEWCLRFGIVPLANQQPCSREEAAAYTEQLRALGLANGIDRIGVAPATVMQRAREALHSRKSVGLHDTMQFTYRNPDRSTNPDAAIANAKSMIVGACSYSADAPAEPHQLSARVARYAWADYYESLRTGLGVVCNALQSDGWSAQVFVDHNALVDREAAYLAGLGWYGKNANLLISGAGSFFVLGSVITDAPLVVNERPVDDGCGACKRCLDSCPTNAIVEPGVIDAAKCLAWLVQKPGVFNRDYRVALADRVYGCDSCQDVCPPTIRLGITTKPSVVRAWVPIVHMLNMEDTQLLQSVGQWYIADRNPMWVRRNLLIVLGNIGNAQDEGVRDVIETFCNHAEPMLRAHAMWSAARLGLHQFIPQTDDDPVVVEELRNLPEVRVG